MVYKLRASTGIQVTRVASSNSIKNQSDGEIALLDADKTLTFFLKVDEKINDTEAYL